LAYNDTLPMLDWMHRRRCQLPVVGRLHFAVAQSAAAIELALDKEVISYTIRTPVTKYDYCTLTQDAPSTLIPKAMVYVPQYVCF